MIRCAAFALSVFAAGPAVALSCAVPSVADSYGGAAASATDYVIGVGALALTGQTNPPEGAVAQGGDINQMVGYTQPAQFTGGLFTGNGFGPSQHVNIEVNVTCIVAWCGQAAEVDNALFFFRATNAGYVLDEGACPGNVFYDPTPAQLQQVQQCYDSGTC
ncbi:hypothetical protein [Jannaschia sp. CCS1]|uniref:hypothetical protein n=1 Tax=Jannaschia sp. (strain CCS1) TaxID=290400 RepID=UPI000053B7F8|nr:hypothetical protein [Jannaschia sp. CCS1]ABD53300.1 hypothetical protein Jann_0383 [Jannaschia sp. CCS1]